MTQWNEANIPDQSGRTVLITGANSGLGLHSAQALAARGARILLACRNAQRGEAAREQVAATAMVEPEVVELDLTDLSGVRTAAGEIRNRCADTLDVLLNNAGVMATPKRQTQDGFELQLGTNHLGHALLTWLLLPALRPGARVVNVSSLAHRFGGLDLTDLNFRNRFYDPVRAYGQSKLANLLFMFELDRRVESSGRDLISVAAHPGMSSTELTSNSAQMFGTPGRLKQAVSLGTRYLTQPAERGALPQLYAATAPDVHGGEYYGPNGMGEIHGYPKHARLSRTARDPRLARQLWNATSELVQLEPTLR